MLSALKSFSVCDDLAARFLRYKFNLIMIIVLMCYQNNVGWLIITFSCVVLLIASVIIAMSMILFLIYGGFK